MINEIVNFVKIIPEEYHTSNLRMKNGYYFSIPANRVGDFNPNVIEKYFIDKKNKITDLNNNIETILPSKYGYMDYYSTLLDMNKPFGKGKKIHSSVPMSIFIKSENIYEIEKYIDDYFNDFMIIMEKAEKDNETISNLNEIVQKSIKFFQKYLKSIILPYAKTEPGIYIKLFIEYDEKTYKEMFSLFSRNKIFLVDKFNLNKKIENENKVFGLSSFLNSLNENKKIYLTHQTSNFRINNRISIDMAFELLYFERLLKNNKLPKTLPVFIFEDEWNKKVLSLYSYEGINTLPEILKSLYSIHSKELENFYLINWQKSGMDIVINDIDYVEKFEYKLENTIIENLLVIKQKGGDILPDVVLDNIFNFENEVAGVLFNGNLTGYSKKENARYYRYFDDIKVSSFCSKTDVNNLYKYRLNFYNYIYKSRKNAITHNDFYDLVMSSIRADIIDANNDNRYTISKKLNILFSLNKIFDQNSLNQNKGVLMPSQMKQLKNNIDELLFDEDKHIETDVDFAFASGQLIYYLVYQSKAGNKTHALIEPYVSKSDPELFKKAITQGILTYKHALSYGTKRFSRISSEVLGYSCESSIRNLLPIILAGYFSPSIFFEKKDNNGKESSIIEERN